MKRLVQQVFEAPTYEEGKKRDRGLIVRFEERYPSAMACLGEDLDACLEHLRFPELHRKRIRTTNLLERLWGEGKRRTKVIPRFPAALRLVYATLLKASDELARCEDVSGCASIGNCSSLVDRKLEGNRQNS